jgi:hypothetical protein
MRDSNEVMQCPKCQGTELGKGKQRGYANITPSGKMGFNSEVVYTICTDCGYIIEGYVTKPRRFKDTF